MRQAGVNISANALQIWSTCTLFEPAFEGINMWLSRNHVSCAIMTFMDACAEATTGGQFWAQSVTAGGRVAFQIRMTAENGRSAAYASRPHRHRNPRFRFKRRFSVWFLFQPDRSQEVTQAKLEVNVLQIAKSRRLSTMPSFPILRSKCK